jgi:hypothetical protein
MAYENPARYKPLNYQKMAQDLEEKAIKIDFIAPKSIKRIRKLKNDVGSTFKIFEHELTRVSWILKEGKTEVRKAFLFKFKFDAHDFFDAKCTVMKLQGFHEQT